MWRIGQVIVTEGGWDALGRLLRWGEGSPWTHTFLVTGNDELVEADTRVGVRTYRMTVRMQQLRAEGRSWVVLEAPGMSVADRLRVVDAARTRQGCGYDYIEALRYAVSQRMRPSSPRRVTCARLIAEAFLEGAGWLPFSRESVETAPAAQQADLLRGHCSPSSLLLYGRFRLHDAHLTPGKRYPLQRR